MSLTKPTRQVPLFLQKLYEIVNDPANQDLIRWSDAGDSFLVLDQERFASEILGRWFKHRNFNSFVRQLNLYGFRKIPQLHQGALHSQSNTREISSFENAHFLRGQPDQLSLIQRRRQPISAGDDASSAGTSLGTTSVTKDASGNGAVGTLATNQLMDVNSVVSGIEAIKRQQAAISADLNELKSSNQLLWQEAMAARERHQKHQDMINRILRFLAGVFGHGHGEGPLGMGEDGYAMVARKPERLMIEDERKPAGVVGAEDAGSVNLFGSVDTPSEHPSTEPFTMPRFASVDSNVTDRPSLGYPAPAAPPSNTTSVDAPLVASPGTVASNDDRIVQTALTSVLNSPLPLPKLLAALSAQPIPPEAVTPVVQPHQQLITSAPYNGNSSQSIPMNTEDTHSKTGHLTRIPSTSDSVVPTGALSPTTLSLLGVPSDVDPFALQQQDDQLQKTYKSAAEINSDVDELQSSIQSLIQSLGIDPATLDTGGVSAALPSTTGAGDGMDAFADMNMNMGDMDIGQDFDFDSLWTDMSRANEVGESTGKLDVMSTPEGNLSKTGNAMRDEEPFGVDVGARGQKRKSEVTADGASTIMGREHKRKR